jgi:hypothetical protein
MSVFGRALLGKKRSQEQVRSSALLSQSLERELERSQNVMQQDASRLTKIVDDISGRINGPCVAYNGDGQVFVHPELLRELERPGNEKLKGLLQESFGTCTRG